VASQVKVFEVLAQTFESCDDYPHIKLLSTEHNNLGGYGPELGVEGIRYLAQFVNHQQIEDLVVDVHASRSYRPANPDDNGLSTGRTVEVTGHSISELCQSGHCDEAMSFGSVNLHSGMSGTITFSFFDRNLQPKYLDEISLTWFDLDHAGCVGWPDSACKAESVESVMPIGNYSAYLSSTTTVEYRLEHSGTVFTARNQGIGEDNPINSRLLTQDQVDKAVTSMYKSVHEIKVTLAASEGVAGAARYFFFDFVPTLLCAETVKEWPPWVKIRKVLPPLTSPAAESPASRSSGSAYRAGVP